MSSVPIVFNISCACLLTLLFLYRCGNYRRQHPITTGAVFIAWSFSVLIVFLLPLDISLVRLQGVSNVGNQRFSRRRISSAKGTKLQRMTPALVRGRTSIRSLITSSGGLSTGHRSFSLGESKRTTTLSDWRVAFVSLGWSCPSCSRSAGQVGSLGPSASSHGPFLSPRRILLERKDSLCSAHESDLLRHLAVNLRHSSHLRCHELSDGRAEFQGNIALRPPAREIDALHRSLSWLPVPPGVYFCSC